MKRIVQSRKLLVASIGVATVLYACEKREAYPPGNLMPPEPQIDAGMVTSGNLVAPPPQEDAAPPPLPLASDAGPLPHEVVPPGNLMPPPPPPPDAGPKKPPNHHPPGNLMPPPPHPKPKP